MDQSILVPMDASPKSQKALEHAFERYEDAQLTVLHVTNPVEDTYMTGEEDFFADYEALEERSREHAESIFETATELAAERGREIRTEREFGPPATKIVEFAEEQEVDHIVIGSHGRSGLARLFLGSVAENVARRAPVPVTIVK